MKSRLLFILMLGALGSYAQDFLSWKYNDRYFSLSFGTGTATYFGDIATKLQTRPNTLNIGYEARLLSHFSARIEGSKYKLEGKDSWAKFGSFKHQRNHAFASDNWEANFQIIYYFQPYQGDYYKRPTWDAYAGLGVGFTTYDPYREYQNEIYYLRDISTETNKKKYGTTALVFPLSVGVKFKVNDFTNLNFELGYRFASTDYLDDVSGTYPDLDDTEVSLAVIDLANPKDLILTSNQSAYEQLVPGSNRGNSSSFDSYLLAMLKVEIYLPRLWSDGLKKSSIR